MSYYGTQFHKEKKDFTWNEAILNSKTLHLYKLHNIIPLCTNRLSHTIYIVRAQFQF